MAPRQNHFFVELVAAVRDELDQIGVASSLHTGDFPAERDGRVYVLTPPHEWFALHGRRNPPSKRQLRSTLFLCAEQPETSFFVDNALLAPFAGAVFDINPASLAEFERHRLPAAAHAFQLGWTRTWSTISPDDFASGAAAVGRDIDVLHLGIDSPRRAKAIAAAARPLSRRNAHLILASGDVPNDANRSGFAVDEEKLELLRRSKILLNIHQGERPYFEWLRVVQAVCQGCAVVTEHSVAHAPMVAGTHMLAGQPPSLGLLCTGLLDDEGHRAELAENAFALLKDELPLAMAVERMASVAEEVAKRPVAPLARDIPELRSPPMEAIDIDQAFAGPVVTDPEQWRTSSVRRGLKDLRLEMMQLRRDLKRSDLERTLGRRVPQVVLDSHTPAWEEPLRPTVSVITALYNHDEHIEDALESALSGTYRDLELVVVDDGSTDGSAAAVRRVMERRPTRPILLARHPVNRGLGSARNEALTLARGRFVFVLDADNYALPHGIGRLVQALEADASAGFAYGMLEIFGPTGPLGLTSALPWEPRRLRNGNYIDAMALWRTEVLRACEGYTSDHRLYGWEDYDLLCRFAERDGRAAFVSQPVARYRSSRHSMISTTDLSVATAYSVLAERYPALFEGVTPAP